MRYYPLKGVLQMSLIKPSVATGLIQPVSCYPLYSKASQRDGKHTLVLFPASGERLTVKDWKHGQLGITLNADEPEQPPTPSAVTDHDNIHLVSNTGVSGLSEMLGTTQNNNCWRAAA